MAETINIQRLANGYNVRSDLEISGGFLASIRDHGVLHPLLVYKLDGQVLVKEGHRRLQAALTLHIVEVPITWVDPPLEMSDEIVEQLVINSMQKPLSYTDRANQWAVLIQECGWSQKAVAEKFKLSETYVSLAVRTLKLPEALRKALDDHRIEPSAVEAIIPLPLEIQEEIADQVIRAKTVRRVNDVVAGAKAKHNIGRGGRAIKQMQEAVPEGADPLEALALGAMEEALSTLATAEDIAITCPQLRDRGRLTVKHLLETAHRLEQALQ